MNDNIADVQSFLFQRLREWLDLFPGLRLYYYFEQCADEHIVKLDPDSYPMDDERFLNAQIALISEMIEIYPEHSVTPFYESRFDRLLGEGTIEITHEYPSTATPLSAAS
jgi:hypothetical protein